MITTKQLRKTIKNIDETIEEYKNQTSSSKRDWKKYEAEYNGRIICAVREFNPLLDEVISKLKFTKRKGPGVKKKLEIKQRALLLLIKILFGKSNREMAVLLSLFSLLTGINVSYKTIERLYSDEDLRLVMHNLHVLILKTKNVKSIHACGDGTGYTLTIKKHYASMAQRLKDKLKSENKLSQTKKLKKKQFVYSFALMDIQTRMYVSYGTSFQSEKDAYNSAIQMFESLNIGLESLRLDRYYSSKKLVQKYQEKYNDVSIYLIPKKNATISGCKSWKKLVKQFIERPFEYLQEYYKRNQSESGFSEDKRRFGWRIAQKRLDRIDFAQFFTLIWHNLYWLGG